MDVFWKYRPSKNIKNLEEARNMSALIQANILILLHPFIPFFTESVWQNSKFNNYFKTPLMFKDWNLEPQSNFNKSYNKIDWLIDLVTSIRSTKVDLNVAPGAIIDISVKDLSKEKRSIIANNLDLFKRLGRISEVFESGITYENKKKGIKILVGKESVTLYFDLYFNVDTQKERMYIKVKNIDKKIANITTKLKNKSFLKNAPKRVVDNEKKALTDYKIELKKLNHILNSIKN